MQSIPQLLKLNEEVCGPYITSLSTTSLSVLLRGWLGLERSLGRCAQQTNGLAEGMDEWTDPDGTLFSGHVIPPLNFAMVSPGIYRSGYPGVLSHSFLKSLKLKTIIYLCPENCNEANINLCKENGISIMQFGIQGNKEPFVDVPEPVCFLKIYFAAFCVFSQVLR